MPLVMTIRAGDLNTHVLDVSSSPPVHIEGLEPIARWVLFADLDLRPFYNLIKGHHILAPIIKELWGMKPMRPPSLFKMAITVITEQQISLAAATSIRGRFVTRFGDRVEDIWVFPEATKIARTSIKELRACGLSQRKAEYILDLANLVADGSMDFEALKTIPDAEVRDSLLAIRGWGMWSVNYFLIRGLARSDSVPSDDLAVRSVVGKHLGKGDRASAIEVESMLKPFRPYRGLVAFYLLVYDRLNERAHMH